MSRLVIVYSGKQVTRHDIEPLLDIGQAEVEQNPTALADMERIHLIKVLTMSRGVVGGRKGAAAVLNVPKSTLQYKLHKHGLNPQDYR
jgi:DNA-binding NtrC family response regulator